MARKTQAQQGRELLRASTQFPDFNIIDYDASLSKNLAFYNNEVHVKTKKAAALKYWKKQGKDTSAFSRMNAQAFSTVGAIAHMIVERGIALQDKDTAHLEEKYVELCALRPTKKRDEKPVVSKDEKGEKDEIELNRHLAEFNAAIDVLYTGGTADAKAYIEVNNVKPVIAQRIADYYRKHVLDEIDEIPQCEQLQEAYSHLGKRELKALREKVVKLITDCETAAAIAKVRKPRAKKKRPPSVVAKNVKYMQSYPDLGMKSLHPEKLVDASEVWIFNVKTRRLFRYVALENETLSVKGTTLVNFDPIKSGGKIIRKPEVQLKGYEKMTTRPLTKLYKDVNAVESKATGRINEDCIILKAF